MWDGNGMHKTAVKMSDTIKHEQLRLFMSRLWNKPQIISLSVATVSDYRGGDGNERLAEEVLLRSHALLNLQCLLH